MVNNNTLSLIRIKRKKATTIYFEPYLKTDAYLSVLVTMEHVKMKGTLLTTDNKSTLTSSGKKG